MPGDIGRIPIISLSGCKYLTDLISELPVPQPTQIPIRCQTLLYDSKVAHDAYRCIQCQDETLIDALVWALERVGKDEMYVHTKCIIFLVVSKISLGNSLLYIRIHQNSSKLFGIGNHHYLTDLVMDPMIVLLLKVMILLKRLSSRSPYLFTMRITQWTRN